MLWCFTVAARTHGPGTVAHGKWHSAHQYALAMYSATILGSFMCSIAHIHFCPFCGPLNAAATAILYLEGMYSIYWSQPRHYHQIPLFHNFLRSDWFSGCRYTGYRSYCICGFQDWINKILEGYLGSWVREKQLHYSPSSWQLLHQQNNLHSYCL